MDFVFKPENMSTKELLRYAVVTPESKWGRNELGKILNEVRKWFMLKSAGVYKDIVEG